MLRDQLVWWKGESLDWVLAFGPLTNGYRCKLFGGTLLSMEVGAGGELASLGPFQMKLLDFGVEVFGILGPTPLV